MNTYAVAPKHEMLIIDMSNLSMIDLSGIYALEDLVKDTVAKDIEVFVSNANSHIKELLEKMNFIEHIGKDRYKDSKKSVISIISEHYHL